MDILKVEKAICEFSLSTSRDKKVRTAKDHGKNFQSRLATSFSGIVHGCIFQVSGVVVYKRGFDVKRHENDLGIMNGMILRLRM